MSPKDIATAVLVGVAVLVAALSVVGAYVGSRPEDKLHLVTPAAAVSPVLVLAGLVIHESFNTRSLYTLVVVVGLLVTQPVLNHITGHAILVREHGDRPFQDEEGST